MGSWGSWGTPSKKKGKFVYVEDDNKKGWGTWGSQKEKEETNPMDKVNSEIEKKRTALKHYGIEDTTQPKDDRNWAEKMLNTPKDTGFLGDLLDVISRGQYASANLSKSLVKGQDIGEALKHAGKGVTGAERNSYSDVLDEAGMKKGFTRSALGFVGDILLDPTTYLTLGSGAVAKTGAKAIGKAVLKEGAEVAAKEVAKEAVEKGGLGFLSKAGGGVKFAGRSIVPQKVIDKGLEKTGVTKAANILRDSKPAQVLGKAFVPNFREAGTEKNIWNEFIDLKKNYQNELNYGQHKAINDAVGLGKKLTKEERELITHGIQNPILLKGQRKDVIDTARAVKKAFKTMSKEEMDKGLLNKLHKNYVPGIYPEKGKSALEGIIYNPSLKASLGKHAKQKTFNTLQDAIDAGLKPETDISKLLGLRSVASKRATTTQDFINNVVENFGQKIKHTDIDKLPDHMGVYLPKGNLKMFPQGTIPKEYIDLLKGTSQDELIEIPAHLIKNGIGISKNVPIVALPRQIAKDLNQFKNVAWDEGTQGAVKWLIDKPTNLWKAYATATNPGFHIRNAASNAFQTYLNNGSALANPVNHLRALGVTASDLPYIGKKIGKKNINVGGQKMTLAEAKDLMEKEGVLNQGWFDKDLPDVLEEQLNQGVAGKFKNPNLINPLSQNNALIKTGRYVGGGVENQARAFNFLTDLKRNGGNIKQAAKNTDKTLFDYGDLTDFEKNIMRRAVPFYTWLRKNIPYQAEQLAKQPGKYAAIPKAINAVEDNTKSVDEKYLPEYMENWVRTPFNQNGNPLYLNPNMPYADLDKLDPEETKKNILSSINPLFKIPLELSAGNGKGEEFFFGTPIERYKGEMKKAPGYLPNDLPEPFKGLLGARMGKNPNTGEQELQVPAKTRYLMKQVPFLENISKSMEYEGDKKFNQLLSFLAGAKVAPYEIEKAKKYYTYGERDKLRDLFDKLEQEGKIPADWSDKFKRKKEQKSGW